jgi:hypothetical protein
MILVIIHPRGRKKSKKAYCFEQTWQSHHYASHQNFDCAIKIHLLGDVRSKEENLMLSLASMDFNKLRCNRFNDYDVVVVLVGG